MSCCAQIASARNPKIPPLFGEFCRSNFRLPTSSFYHSPPVRWGLLDFMSVACSSSSSPPPLLSSSSSTATLDAQCSLSDLNREYTRLVFSAGPQPRVSTPSVLCRTLTATILAHCSLPDLNHDHPRPVLPGDFNREYTRPVFSAEPQPRVSTPNVLFRTLTATILAVCRTSTTTIHA